MTKKACIVSGLLGQDATILSSLLLKKDFKVYGTIRPSTSSNFWRLEEEGILDHPNLEIVQCDISDSGAVFDLINKIKPDWFINLAALSAVGDSFNNPVVVGQIDALGPLYCLEAIRQCSRNTKFYQASTSEMVANEKNEMGVANQDTKILPESPYAAAKAYAYFMTRIYRNSYKLFACSSLLYNHGSKYRGLYFIERKIGQYVAQLKLGMAKDKLKLGNLDASRDIGSAWDYMKGIIMIMEADQPDDYTLCTGKTYSIRQILDIAFSYIEQNWEDYVVQDERFMRPSEVHNLIGDYSKAKDLLAWEPENTLEDVIEEIIEADTIRLKNQIVNRTDEWEFAQRMMGK